MFTTAHNKGYLCYCCCLSRSVKIPDTTSDANRATVATSWDKANSRLYSLLFFATSSSARLTVQSHRTAATSADGNGQAAWAALSARFDGRTQEARRACHRELFGLKHVAGGDPIDFFSKACELKLRLATLGETVSDDVYLDITLSGLTSAPEFHFIREMHYRTEFTSVDDL